MRIKKKAKNRPSRPIRKPWQPLRFVEKTEFGDYYENESYSVTIARVEYEGIPCIRIGIANYDQSAHRDWRDFQEIKNQLAGPEWEGFEIYPRESRKIDVSNYFYLWCFENSLPFGIFRDRIVLDSNQAIAPQRAL